MTILRPRIITCQCGKQHIITPYVTSVLCPICGWRTDYDGTQHPPEESQ